MSKTQREQQQNTIIMPLATAKWLISNSSLTFEQIADFCQLHPMTIAALANDEIERNLRPSDPRRNLQLTQAEIERCQADPKAILRHVNFHKEYEIATKAADKAGKKSKRYVSMRLRAEKLNAIEWVVKKYPEIPENAVAKLLGTTKATVISVKEKKCKNYDGVKAKDPVALGICKQTQLDGLVMKYSQENGGGGAKSGKDLFDYI